MHKNWNKKFPFSRMKRYARHNFFLFRKIWRIRNLEIVKHANIWKNLVNAHMCFKHTATSLNQIENRATPTFLNFTFSLFSVIFLLFFTVFIFSKCLSTELPTRIFVPTLFLEFAFEFFVM